MRPRSERRRRERSGEAREDTLISRITGSGFLMAGLIGAGVAIIIAGILLLAGGDDDEGGTPEPTLLTGTPVPVVEPGTPDEEELAEVARRTIESLPSGTWPLLYDEFTEEFQERCSREEFAEVGEQAAEEQGEQLRLIRFMGVNQFNVEEAEARLIIVGRIGELGEYTIGADFVKVDGEWRITPVEQTEGCQAFDRLSG